MLHYSVIIPIYNEAENIPFLVKELEWVMHNHKDSWELIFIDDGSTDQSEQVLEKLKASKPFIRCVQLKKNYGQSSAFIAGVKAARGTWIISLDGDGQNDPRDIPKLLELSDYDLVAGIRQKRQDSWYKKLIGKAANAVRSRILNDDTTDTGCSLKMYRRSCLDKIPLFNGMHRFLPALFKIEGFSCTEIPVHHRQRRAGKSKYHLFNRGISLVFDLFGVLWMRKRRLHYEVKRELP